MPDTKACIESKSLRVPEVGDASALWRLVNDSEVLDRNSSYLYLLLCRDFAQTCVVAEQNLGNRWVCLGLQPPAQARCPLHLADLCVQVGPDGRVSLRKMLTGLVNRSRDQSAIRFVEATVAPSNHASLRMFESLAKQLGLRMTRDTGFDQSVFPDDDHEAEPLIRIGPLDGTRKLESYTSSEKESHQ